MFCTFAHLMRTGDMLSKIDKSLFQKWANMVYISDRIKCLPFFGRYTTEIIVLS